MTHAQNAAARPVEGWCNRRDTDHEGQYMHVRRDSCDGFVSDAEHKARRRHHAC